MARRTRRPRQPKQIATHTHDDASRPNIPTAEHQTVVPDELKAPIRVQYQRRNRDLDPQLVWRGKDERDMEDLTVNAPPIYIQEKVHPKALVDDLRRQSDRIRNDHAAERQPDFADLFSDFNGLPEGADSAEFYQHDANWSNRMILGDSLQVMASLSEREDLRGKVQCIYIDPPYGITFNSNFQWSTTSGRVSSENRQNMTREAEQVKAYRDTWRDGIHTYLSYLRDRLTIARDLLTESGSIFVQIGDENVHRVRMLMDEVFGDMNFVSLITIRKTTSENANLLGSTTDFMIWYSKDKEQTKFRTLYQRRSINAESRYSRIDYFGRKYRLDNITSSRPAGDGDVTSFHWNGQEFDPGTGTFKTTSEGLHRLNLADRLYASANGKLNYRRFQDDFSVSLMGNLWADISGAVQSRTDPKVYVVQTSISPIQRCILMTTDPGDLVLDPTCGAGTTAYTAEQWGRRWITIDTSRVALALARARIMGARYPYYLLADSPEGQVKEAEITRRDPSEMPTYGNIRHGFVNRRVPHIKLGDISDNSEIDVIWEEFRQTLEPLRQDLNAALGVSWQEWEIPREADDDWSAAAKRAHAAWWKARIARQREIDASIAARAEFEYLYDKPYEDRRKVRVAGPFTVESVSPHRTLGVDENGDVLDPKPKYSPDTFAQIILDNLKRAGVQQARKEDRITFNSLAPWPGHFVCAEGRYSESANGADSQDSAGPERRAAVFIGPEFGTVSRPDLVEAAREAAECGFDVLIACAFNYDVHTTEFERLGRIPVLKARMNADLHMAGDLKNTGSGNLFVIFGEPDIEILDDGDDAIRARVNGVDVYHPASGEIRSDGPDGIACWFIDTDYDQESFFVRHAYFLGASDPYRSLKTTLKAEIDAEAWATLKSDTSRPFPRPASGRIAVKVINHLGDEAMKVFRV